MEEEFDQYRGETLGIPREEKPIEVGIKREIGTSVGKLALEVKSFRIRWHRSRKLKTKNEKYVPISRGRREV